MKSIQIIKLIQVKEDMLPFGTTAVSSSIEAARIAHTFLEGVDREHFCVICLNAKNKINALHTVSIGTVEQCLVAQRECFKLAIVSNSVSIIVFHNHPSGDPQPSSQDIELTRALVKAGDILNITVHDHIIIGDGMDNYVSLKESQYAIWS